MHHWSWYTFGAAQFFAVYMNALNLVHYSDSQYKGSAFVLTLLIQFFIWIAVDRELRVPFLFPKLKWWESGFAGMHHLLVAIQPESKSSLVQGQLLDISAKGCFIKCPVDFNPFEKVSVKIEGYGQEIDVPGEVVWNAKSTVTHPKGLGVKFLELDRKGRRKMKVISKRFIQEKEKPNVPIKVLA